jgi:hypothetical protein
MAQTVTMTRRVEGDIPAATRIIVIRPLA